MTMLFRRWPSRVMVGSLLVLPVAQVQASGYHFGSQSVAAQGSAHANGAEAADPSTIFYNPAGLARLKGTQVSSGLSILLPDGDYKDKGSRDVFGNPVSGDAGEFLPDAAAAPNFYFSHEINDRVTVGLGIFTPFGAKLDYKEDWAGRYGIQSASLETVTFNPSIAFRFNEHHSIGFGVSAQYIKSVQRGAADVKGASRQLAGQFVTANQELTELEARLIALIRRARGSEHPRFACGPLSYDSATKQFRLEHEPLTLTPREHAVLRALIQHSGEAMSKRELVERVFSDEQDVNPEAIRAVLEGVPA